MSTIKSISDFVGMVTWLAAYLDYSKFPAPDGDALVMPDDQEDVKEIMTILVEEECGSYEFLTRLYDLANKETKQNVAAFRLCHTLKAEFGNYVPKDWTLT